MMPRPSLGRKNYDWRKVRLKNLQAIVDLSFIGNNYTNGIGRLPAFSSLLAQFSLGQPKADIVALERAVADQDSVGQRTLTKQVQLVFTRCEINRRETSCRDFSIDRHRESGRNKWATRNVGALRAPLSAAAQFRSGNWASSRIIPFR